MHWGEAYVWGALGFPQTRAWNLKYNMKIFKDYASPENTENPKLVYGVHEAKISQ